MKTIWTVGTRIEDWTAASRIVAEGPSATSERAVVPLGLRAWTCGVNVILFWVLPSSERKSVSLGGPRLRTFALLIRVLLNIEMSLKPDPNARNRSTCRKTCSGATLPTTNPTWTDLGSKPVVRGDRPMTSRPLRSLTGIYIFKIHLLPYRKHLLYRHYQLKLFVLRLKVTTYIQSVRRTV
jgi:hypothetical protein